MISSIFATIIRLLILIALRSQNVNAYTITGSAFQVRLPIRSTIWDKQSRNNTDPYAEWDPTCYEFYKATTTLTGDFKTRLVGCRSKPDTDGNTDLKVYLAILREDLNVEEKLQCVRDAYREAFIAWKTALSRHFQIEAERVQFSQEYEEVRLEVQRISGTATEHDVVLSGLKESWSEERKLRVKTFLVHWMRSISNQFPLILIRTEWKDDLHLTSTIDMCFDVTGITKGLRMELFTDHLVQTAETYQETLKLTDFSEEYTKYVDSSRPLFKQCVDDSEQAAIDVETITGSAFEVELEIEESDWAKEAETDLNPYSGWSPICDQFSKITYGMDEVIADNLIGCRSVGVGKKTQLTVYMALSVTDLTDESTIACKKKLFTKWKDAVRKHFKLRSEDVLFHSTYRPVKLQVMKILGDVKRNGSGVLSAENWSDQVGLELKNFLVPWMKSLDENYQLTFFTASWTDYDTLSLEMTLLFDITGMDEINMVEQRNHLIDTAKEYQGSTKLTHCKLDFPQLPETSEERFTSCDDDDVDETENLKSEMDLDDQ